MAWVKLNLAEQMTFAKSQDVMERVTFSIYPVLPVVADYMIRHESHIIAFKKICENLFRTSNSNIWPSTLEKAARKKFELLGVDSEFDNALVSISLHLNINVETITFLFELNDRNINWGIASNPRTPKAILDKLADLNDPEINTALGCNPNTPEETRKKIKAPRGFYPGYYYTLQGIGVVASGN